jgi:hypothetical protein
LRCGQRLRRHRAARGLGIRHYGGAGLGERVLECEGRKGSGELGCGGVANLRERRERPGEYGIKRRIAAVQGLEARVVLDLESKPLAVFGLEVGLAEDELVKHDGDRPQVRRDIHVAGAEAFARHVANGAEGVRGVGSGERLRDAEVEDLHLAVAVYHDVLGLDVAVNDAGSLSPIDDAPEVVGVVQNTAEFAADLRSFSVGNLVGSNVAAQVDAIDELHRDEVVAFHLAMFKDGGDSGFLIAELLLENGAATSCGDARDAVLVGAGLNQLEGKDKRLGIPRVLGSIHSAHAPAGELLQDAVRTEGVASAQEFLSSVSFSVPEAHCGAARGPASMQELVQRRLSVAGSRGRGAEERRCCGLRSRGSRCLQE